MQDQKIPTNSEDTAFTKTKRGLFPRLPLSEVLELPKAIYAVGQGEVVRRLKVFDYLRKSPGSSSSRALVTIAGMYGLTKGSYIADYLELTEAGKKLVTLPLRSRDSYLVAYDILFENEVFKSFVDYWKEKALPDDDLASDWLSRTFKLSFEDATSCWLTMKENILDWGLTEELSGKMVIRSREVALESMKDHTDLSSLTNSELTRNQSAGASSGDFIPFGYKPEKPTPKPFGTQMIERDFQYGRARLVLPERMTSEEISKLKLLIDGLVVEVKDQE